MKSRWKTAHQPSPCGSAFLKAFPASTKLVAESCLFWSCMCSLAAWQNALPAAARQHRWHNVQRHVWVMPQKLQAIKTFSLLNINLCCCRMQHITITHDRSVSYLPVQFFAILNMLAALAYISQASSNLWFPLEINDKFYFNQMNWHVNILFNGTTHFYAGKINILVERERERDR